MKQAAAPSQSASSPSRPSALDQVAGILHAGKVYRREDLAQVSNAVDRHLRELVSGGALKRLAQGLYYAPKKSAFGVLPPDDQELVTAFLRDKDFLFPLQLQRTRLGHVAALQQDLGVQPQAARPFFVRQPRVRFSREAALSEEAHAGILAGGCHQQSGRTGGRQEPATGDGGAQAGQL